MAELTKSQILTALDEWGEYVPRFEALSAGARADFLKTQGYASLHDLLAHIVGWWEEAEAIVNATIEERDRPRRDYEFDTFNAESVAHFKDTSESQLLAHFDGMRQKLTAQVKGLTDEQFKIRRVSVWLNGVILAHIKEHNLYASRFLIRDALAREWATYISGFGGLPADKQTAFLKKQGFARFRDLVAHIIGWWDLMLESIIAIAKDIEYPSPSEDIDAFNARIIQNFSALDESEVWKKFESNRQSLLELAITLSPETLDHKKVQDWFTGDVLEHYFEHAY
jgi:hypothetical protein